MRLLPYSGFVLLAAVAGCSSYLPAEQPCTVSGSVHGLAVTVASDVAPARSLVLEYCVDGQCRQHRVHLSAGTTAGDEDCTGSGPEAQCSAELTPDGTQFGHVMAELPAGPVEVSGHYRQAGRTVELAAATVEAEASYPNGPDCGADGTQAHVTLDSSGLH